MTSFVQVILRIPNLSHLPQRIFHVIQSVAFHSSHIGSLIRAKHSLCTEIEPDDHSIPFCYPNPCLERSEFLFFDCSNHSNVSCENISSRSILSVSALHVYNMPKKKKTIFVLSQSFPSSILITPISVKNFAILPSVPLFEKSSKH